MVLATVQTNVAGVFVRAAVPNGSTHAFTIYLNKAPGSSTSPKSVVIAWFVVS